MFLSHHHIAALFIIFHCTSVIVNGITTNALNRNQPLVIKKEGSGTKYYLTPSPPNPAQDGTIVFSSRNSPLVSACPAAESNSNYPGTLTENENDNDDCETAFQPTSEQKQSVLSNTSMYSIGYWLFWYVPAQRRLSSTPTFVKIYDMHYSQDNGVIYTSHKIFPGPRLSHNTQIQSLHSGLITDSEYENDFKIQLVPYDDFIPFPWKFTTQLDFNSIYANELIATGMNKLIDFLRDYSDRLRKPITVYSGKKDRMWYWKAVEYKGAGVLLAIVDPDADGFQNPCASQCANYSLGTLQTQIPNLRCCPLTENLASSLKLLVLEKNLNARYLQFSQRLIFS